jgi:trehalose 6-phosphate synthase
MWTQGALHRLIRNRLRDTRFILVSHREPYIHHRTSGGVVCLRGEPGLASTLNSMMSVVRGLWVAHGSGDADRRYDGANQRAFMPPRNPAYILRRVWLSKKLQDEYDHGLAQEGLWPLCHAVFHRPSFEWQHWKSYRRANQIFAEAVLEEAGGKTAFVFVPDYHFGLLPRILKARNPNLIVAQFWQIPWPHYESFRIFPWTQELIEGMLGSDLLGFQSNYDCRNFLECVDRTIEARVDRVEGEVIRNGKSMFVRPFPIGIDYERHTAAATASEVDREMHRWRRRLGLRTEFVGIGIDPLDCSKGIPDRLEALDLFFSKHPEFCGRLTFVQIGVPSREQIRAHQPLYLEITGRVKKINAKWGRDYWRPINLLRGAYSQSQLIALHRLADFCLITSPHEGMNLAAKEFVASRFDADGVLIVSQFTETPREFPDALHVNPFAKDEVAEAIRCAVTLAPDQRRRRMLRLRAAVAEANIYRWAGKIISTLVKFNIAEKHEAEEAEKEEWASVAMLEGVG